MEPVLQYKCPRCGGNIDYNISLKVLKCTHCDTVFNTEDLAAYENELKDLKADSINWHTQGIRWTKDEDGYSKMIFVCKSCGGEIIADENAAALNCPWCDNRTIIKKSVAGSLRPDCIIPFKVSKDTAKETIKRCLRRKKMLPVEFLKKMRPDRICGIYVPFWLFDTKAEGKFMFKAIQNKSVNKGDDHTLVGSQWFSVVRQGTMEFSKIPVDGMDKLKNEITESIEPYDLSGLVDFHSSYLSGFLAYRYDVDSDEAAHEATERIRETMKEKLRKTILHFDSFSPKESGKVKIENGEISYALFPVWLLSMEWHGRQFFIAVNGQTGKLAWELPTDEEMRKNFVFSECLFWSVFLCLAALILEIFIFLC